MAVVTINGPPGCLGDEVGLATARLLNADYVDRLILAEAAKRIGSTVQVLEIKAHRKVAMRDRLAYFLQTMLERSAMSGAGGEPYFSPGMEYYPSEEYPDLAQEPLTSAQRLHDRQFIEVTSAVVKDLASTGDVIIIGRGSNMILKDMPGVLHVALVGPSEMLIKCTVTKEHLSWADAEKHVNDIEKARVTYFKKFFKVHPDDPNQYHMVLNMGIIGVAAASEVVAHAAKDVTSAVQLEAR